MSSCNIVSSTQDDSKDDYAVEENQGSIDVQGNESLKETVLVDDEKEIQLTRAQEKVVEHLKVYH